MFQYIVLNLILINPGFATEIVSIFSSSFLIKSIRVFAISIGDFLFALESTMATLVDISQSKFDGGISTLIPFKDSGISKEPSLFSFLIKIIILSK